VKLQKPQEEETETSVPEIEAEVVYSGTTEKTRGLNRNIGDKNRS
jgi:hypothetical protein